MMDEVVSLLICFILGWILAELREILREVRKCRKDKIKEEV